MWNNKEGINGKFKITLASKIILVYNNYKGGIIWKKT